MKTLLETDNANTDDYTTICDKCFEQHSPSYEHGSFAEVDDGTCDHCDKQAHEEMEIKNAQKIFDDHPETLYITSEDYGEPWVGTYDQIKKGMLENLKRCYHESLQHSDKEWTEEDETDYVDEALDHGLDYATAEDVKEYGLIPDETGHEEV